jgi:hypothetical protein
VDFEKRRVVVKQDGALEGDSLPLLDSFVGLTGGVCGSAGPNLKPDEKAGAVAD